MSEVVDIDKMQYGFMPGRENADAGFRAKISCFLHLLIWKSLLIGCQGNLFVLR